MNPVKISNKQTANKRRRSKTSLSPDKATTKAIELSQQLDSLIERCSNNESRTEELNNSASINGEPLITSSQTQKTSFSGKNIKKRRVFSKIAEFKSEEECDYHIRTTNRYPTIITHNDPTKCSLCISHDSHKMISKYYKCKCGLKECNFGYRVTKCNSSSSNWFLSSGGLHPCENISDIEEENEEVAINVRSQKLKPKKKYGIAIRIKLLINGIYYIFILKIFYFY